VKKVIDDEKWLKNAKYPIVIDSSTQGEIADPWEQQGLTPYGQYFEFANIKEHGNITTGTDTGKKFIALNNNLFSKISQEGWPPSSMTRIYTAW
jgi:hypothetical protein